MKGFVSFVSSGPGDPELLTLRALKKIQEAEAILFDDLSAGRILEFASSEADLVAVGKRAGQKSSRQDHINRLLIDYAKSGTKVVRLKSGDVSLFGRLEEEILALKKEQINYEIIPGVPSAMAAVASAGIPLTRRLNARRIQFITGHDIDGELPNDLNIPALVDPNVVTVIFMGKKTFSKLAKVLSENGLPESTPALLAENVSRDNEKLTYSNLGSMPNLIENKSGKGPALIIFGAILKLENFR